MDGIDFIDGMDFIDGWVQICAQREREGRKGEKRACKKKNQSALPYLIIDGEGAYYQKLIKGNSSRCLGIAKPMTLAVGECIDQMLLYDFGLFNPNQP